MRRSLPLLAMLLVAAACSPQGTGPPTTTLTTTAPSTSVDGTSNRTTTSTVPEATITTAPPSFTTGATSLGDPYFPDLGNGGYDVTHYDIALTVDPDTAELEAITTITATATENLATFTLDFVGLDVASVTVDGAIAEHVRHGPKLRITPAGGLPAAEEFVVAVAYSGRPQLIDLISAGVQFGWLASDEGIYVAAEPDGARTWFPSNDHPTDKATFSFAITVPTPFVAAANGELVAVIDDGATRTHHWELDVPMATYLATIVVGEYDRVETAGPDGIVLRDYIPTSFDGELPAAFSITSEAIELLADWFGPFPYDRYGHIVVYDLGGALETQTLSLMGDRALFEEVVVHELAHQWWGDSVTPASWRHIWLNEGFATFSEFLWTEHRRGTPEMLEQIRSLHTTLSAIDHNPIADPQESQLFGPAVYWRGGMTLHALRVELGDDEMLREVFREYFTRFADGNVSTNDFIEVVHEVTGRDFTGLWEEWLYAAELPDLPTG